jgi:Protein of unknown function (DUF3347).
MKNVLLIIVALVIAIVGIWLVWGRHNTHDEFPKQQPLKVGKHSAEFNQSINSIVTAYLSLKDAFVNADTAKIKEQQRNFINVIDSVKLDDLKKDTTGIFQSAQMQISDIKSNAEAISKETDITEMRQDFRMVSENLFPLLKTIHYEGAKLYWQNCPMAFGEGKDASWISNSEEIVNPYLGKNHPEYKGTMVHCGEIKDTIQ